MEDNRKDIVDKLTLGILKTLEKRKGVCEVKLSDTKGCEEETISSWEQKHACIMCNDLRSFYLAMNGVLLTYKVKIREHVGINQPSPLAPTESRVPIGRISVNPLEKLTRINNFSAWSGGRQCTSADIALDNDSDNEVGICDGSRVYLGSSIILRKVIADTQKILKPSFDHRSRIFELESLDGYGKVCYVYLDTKPGIPATHAQVWFVDRSLRWHPLADSFLDYYRLAIMHLGLPQWQFRFTEVGLSPQAKQWFELFCPKRLHEKTNIGSRHRFPMNNLEPAKIFKSRKEGRDENSPSYNCIEKASPIVRKSTSAMNDKIATVKSRKQLGSAKINSSLTKLNSSPSLNKKS